MKKNTLQELIENAKQNEKYIYQRYNGIITKYIEDGDYYIDYETGIGTVKNEHLMLGKVSEKIIDLIEPGDIVNKGYIYEIGNAENGERWVHNLNGLLLYEEDIKIILTKELYEANCYKVGGENGI